MKTILALFFGSFFSLSASAGCVLTKDALQTYKTLSIRACEGQGPLCVFASLRDGTQTKEKMLDENCKGNSYATCTYRTSSFAVRMFLPCAVGRVQNCAAIFNIYDLKTSDGLASCQD